MRSVADSRNYRGGHEFWGQCPRIAKVYLDIAERDPNLVYMKGSAPAPRLSGNLHIFTDFDFYIASSLALLVAFIAMFTRGCHQRSTTSRQLLETCDMRNLDIFQCFPPAVWCPLACTRCGIIFRAVLGAAWLAGFLLEKKADPNVYGRTDSDLLESIWTNSFLHFQAFTFAAVVRTMGVELIAWPRTTIWTTVLILLASSTGFRSSHTIVVGKFRTHHQQDWAAVVNYSTQL